MASPHCFPSILELYATPLNQGLCPPKTDHALLGMAGRPQLPTMDAPIPLLLTHGIIAMIAHTYCHRDNLPPCLEVARLSNNAR